MNSKQDQKLEIEHRREFLMVINRDLANGFFLIGHAQVVGALSLVIYPLKMRDKTILTICAIALALWSHSATNCSVKCA